MPSLSSYDSSAFSDIDSCIKHSKNNKMQIGNVSQKINIANKIIIGQGHIFQEYESVLFPLREDITIDEKYLYRPDYLALDLYGTTDLWYILLWINNMSTLLDFNKLNIKILPISSINVINKIIEDHKKDLQLNRNTPIYLEDLTLKKIVI